ncbi:MAG: D-alanyl-D-alanine carboxypeptidase [Myxococcota bacterium]
MFLTSLLAALGCHSAQDVRDAPRVPVHDPPTGTGPGTATGTDTDPPGTTVDTGGGTTPTTFVPAQGDPWLSVPAPIQLSAGQLGDIGDALDGVRAATSASTGIYVVDAENGQLVYAYAEDVPKKPASNTKLFTTGVAFDELGADHRLEVTAWADALPDASGAVGDLTVVGEHDFSWSTFFYADNGFPAEQLAQRLWDAGLRRVDGTLTIAGEYELEGYQYGYYDAAYYRAAAAGVLLDAIEARGIAVANDTTTSSFAVPGGAVALASRGSVPLSVAAHPLNVYSHNEFADILAHHNGFELGAASTYAEGAQAVADWLGSLGVSTTGLELNDGSGLSHDNRVTPRQIVEMQQAMLERPSGLAWQRTFSTAGVLGTLSYRMLGTDTYGRFRGKTGTLTGVIATSGILYHRTDGHRYLISVLMNDVTDSTYARSLEDQVVEIVADDNRGLGTRPAAPTLQSVLAPGDGTVVLHWDEVSGADGYVLWFSDDGAVWKRDEARYVEAPRDTFVAGELPLESVRHVRVTALGPAGESDPSDVLSARVGAGPAEVLLVDGNDRWGISAGENPMGQGHDFVATTAAAMGGQRFDSAANEAVVAGEVDLHDYDAVVWALGEESTADEALSDAEQALVADAVAGGVALVISGAELAWDLGALGSASDQAFLADVLRVQYVGDDAGTYSAVPSAGGALDGVVGELGFYTPGTMDVSYPDQLQPVNGAQALLGYLGGGGGTAGSLYDDGVERVAVLGFPLECLDDAATRAAVLQALLP